MNKQVAAILFSAILPALPLSAAPTSRAPLPAAASLKTLRPAFDELPSIRRVKPRDVADFAIEDGRLLALWSGQISAPQPVRLETPDLDAEWMAHAPLSPPAGRFSLVRRDLQPSHDGRSWLIQLHGQADRPDTLQVIASSAAPSRATSCPDVNILLAQDSDWTSIRIWSRSGGKLAGDTRLAGADLRAIAAAHALEYRLLIRPLLSKLTAIELP